MDMPPYGRFVDHPWWGVLGWLVPVLIVAMLVGLAVWVVARTTKQQQPAPPPAGWTPIAAGPPPHPAAPDPALEQARMRYAKGEITRDEFLQLAGDLGGAAASSPPTTPTPTPTREAGPDA